MDNLRAERIESVKAGSVAGLSLFTAYGAMTLGNQLVLASQFEVLANLQITNGFSLLVGGAIAWISGFLFGIAYRYIIRTDQNSHLNEGAVLAFGLVRGLAQVDMGLNCPSILWSSGVLGIESVLLFAIARFTLDWAISNGWVKCC